MPVVTLSEKVYCCTCNGSGEALGSHDTGSCPKCKGSGTEIVPLEFDCHRLYDAHVGVVLCVHEEVTCAHCDLDNNTELFICTAPGVSAHPLEEETK